MSVSLIYLASPYSDESEEVMAKRYIETCKAAAKIIKSGKHVFSPIVHWHLVALIRDLPRDAEFWREYNTNVLRRCDHLWILQLDGWRGSVGIGFEIVTANEEQIPISYIDPCTI